MLDNLPEGVDLTGLLHGDPGADETGDEAAGEREDRVGGGREERERKGKRGRQRGQPQFTAHSPSSLIHLYHHQPSFLMSGCDQ